MKNSTKNNNFLTLYSFLYTVFIIVTLFYFLTYDTKNEDNYVINNDKKEMVEKIKEKQSNIYKLLLSAEKIEDKEIIKKIENQLYESIKNGNYDIVEITKGELPLNYKSDYCSYSCLINNNKNNFIDFYKVNENVMNVRIVYIGEKYKLLQFEINKKENLKLFEILNEKENLYLQQEKIIKNEKQKAKEKEIDDLIKLL